MEQPVPGTATEAPPSEAPLIADPSPPDQGAMGDGDDGASGAEQVADGDTQQPPQSTAQPNRTYSPEEVARIQSAADRRYATLEQESRQTRQAIEQLRQREVISALQGQRGEVVRAAAQNAQDLRAHYIRGGMDEGSADQIARDVVGRQLETVLMRQELEISANAVQYARQATRNESLMQARQRVARETGYAPEDLAAFTSSAQLDQFAQAATGRRIAIEGKRRPPMNTGATGVPADVLPTDESRLLDAYAYGEATEAQQVQARAAIRKQLG